MTRLEKCELAIKKGFSYEKETGSITTPTGKTASKVSKNGYIMLTIRNKTGTFYLYGHQFAWYFEFKECVNLIDHKNRIKTDNKILNLRSITKQQNAFNTDFKGTCFDKRNLKYSASIMINGKNKFLGYFKTEAEANEAYKEGKNKYHLIN